MPFKSKPVSVGDSLKSLLDGREMDANTLHAVASAAWDRVARVVGNVLTVFKIKVPRDANAKVNALRELRDRVNHHDVDYFYNLVNDAYVDLRVQVECGDAGRSTIQAVHDAHIVVDVGRRVVLKYTQGLGLYRSEMRWPGYHRFPRHVKALLDELDDARASENVDASAAHTRVGDPRVVDDATVILSAIMSSFTVVPVAELAAIISSRFTAAMRWLMLHEFVRVEGGDAILVDEGLRQIVRVVDHLDDEDVTEITVRSGRIVPSAVLDVREPRDVDYPLEDVGDDFRETRRRIREIERRSRRR